MLDWTLSVSELNDYVRQMLAANPMLRSVKLRGEISGLKRHFSGHLYFTLKDDGARIAAVMFRQQAMALNFTPKDGMQVIASGSVSLYAAAGQYQFYADGLKPEGQGDLYLRFEKLKEKLRNEGLFDESLKKPLPMRATSVGIITSPTGAVVHDIQTVARRRDPSVRLTLCPVNVQGGAAAGEIARAIGRMDALGFDLLIVGRGGGSLEDLWAFNEEIVARAIFKCQTPVISAVGHEVDFTISDFVADVRAATPSVAAELAIADRAELRRTVDERIMRLRRVYGADIALKRARLEGLAAKLDAQGPSRRLELNSQKLGALENRLRLAGVRYVADKHGRLRETCAALALVSPENEIDALSGRLSQLERRLTAAARHDIDGRMRRLEGLNGQLESLSGENVLKRGYAIISVSGKAVAGVRQIQPGDMLSVLMRDGDLSALTLDIKEARAEET